MEKKNLLIGSFLKQPVVVHLTDIRSDASNCLAGQLSTVYGLLVGLDVI